MLENESTSDRILNSIKLQGEATAAQLAAEFSMTKEGARQHLLKMEQQGLVKSTAKSQGVGRPKTVYSLAEKGLAKFPDAHAMITVELLRSVKDLLGENALNLLVSDREKRTYQKYEAALQQDDTLEKRLKKLTQLRTEEGYMADWKKEGGVYYLIENHCPICSAARECQGFCKAELQNFRQLLGPEYEVERVSHILSEGQRCTYKITLREPAKASQ